MAHRPLALLVALLAALILACGGEAPESSGDSTPGEAPAADGLPPEPTLILVDAAGETSRLVRLDPATRDFTELATLAPGSRGLVWDAVAQRLTWASRDGDVMQEGSPDGTGVRELPITGLDSAYAVALGERTGTLYWSDYGTDRIMALPRGETAEPAVLAEGLVSPRAIAVDEEGGWIYWVDRGAGTVQRVSLDGGVIEDLATEGLPAPYGIALDPLDGSLLVADAELGSIFRLEPGGPLEPWLADAGTHPSFVVVDGPTGLVYWTDNRDNVVRRMPRDGGEIEVLAEGLAGPRGLVLIR